jgi:hypothetical protein
LSRILTDFASIDQFEAARTGNLSWFQHHKAAGTLPDLNLNDGNDWLPLDFAVHNGHLLVIRYLVEESGQSVDTTAYNNYALRLAALNGHLDVVRYLIEDSGQPVDATTRDNEALRLAACGGHLPVLRYLIEDSNQSVDVFANNTELLQIAGSNSSSIELREYLELLIPFIENFGFDIAREFFKTQFSNSSKNTTASLMKGRI